MLSLGGKVSFDILRRPTHIVCRNFQSNNPSKYEKQNCRNFSKFRVLVSGNRPTHKLRQPSLLPMRIPFCAPLRMTHYSKIASSALIAELAVRGWTYAIGGPVAALARQAPVPSFGFTSDDPWQFDTRQGFTTISGL
jgi:hypothetical protein